MKIDEIIKELESYHSFGPKIIGLLSKTFPKLTKTDRITGEPCQFKGVHRIASRTICLGANYEAKVNRELHQSGIDDLFVAKALWNGKGQHVGPYTVQHVDTLKKYIFGFPSAKAEPMIYENGKKIWHMKIGQDLWLDENNDEVMPDSLVNFLPKQSGPVVVPWRIFAYESILKIRYAQKEFVC